ncbi:hypothetical protein HRI_001934300 [Hibiscus trionum]|uniref:RNase H type-1 domain-containing protein n=1 Tax=Hibiscus trionum TaxID=183268 RepID=A0A9W7HR74_HIBTR|nr:hypothetical protein HRI_001934300 [Hibiscus trionum]
MNGIRKVGGIGGLARNYKGEIIFSFAESIAFGPPILAEALVLRRGLVLALSDSTCAKSRWIVECDCNTLVDWIFNPESCPRMYKDIIKEIVDWGNSRSCIFRKIDRRVNTVADNLAKTDIG